MTSQALGQAIPSGSRKLMRPQVSPEENNESVFSRKLADRTPKAAAQHLADNESTQVPSIARVWDNDRDENKICVPVDHSRSTTGGSASKQRSFGSNHEPLYLEGAAKSSIPSSCSAAFQWARKRRDTSPTRRDTMLKVKDATTGTSIRRDSPSSAADDDDDDDDDDDVLGTALVAVGFEKPPQHAVLLGRGRHQNEHPGNLRYRNALNDAIQAEICKSYDLHFPECASMTQEQADNEGGENGEDIISKNNADDNEVAVLASSTYRSLCHQGITPSVLPFERSKHEIACRVVYSLRRQGFRFMKKGRDLHWYYVDDRSLEIEKVKQAFRDESKRRSRHIPQSQRTLDHTKDDQEHSGPVVSICPRTAAWAAAKNWHRISLDECVSQNERGQLGEQRRLLVQPSRSSKTTGNKRPASFAIDSTLLRKTRAKKTTTMKVPTPTKEPLQERPKKLSAASRRCNKRPRSYTEIDGRMLSSSSSSSSISRHLLERSSPAAINNYYEIPHGRLSSWLSAFYPSPTSLPPLPLASQPPGISSRKRVTESVENHCRTTRTAPTTNLQWDSEDEDGSDSSCSTGSTIAPEGDSRSISAVRTNPIEGSRTALSNNNRLIEETAMITSNYILAMHDRIHHCQTKLNDAIRMLEDEMTHTVAASTTGVVAATPGRNNNKKEEEEGAADANASNPSATATLPISHLHGDCTLMSSIPIRSRDDGDSGKTPVLHQQSVANNNNDDDCDYNFVDKYYGKYRAKQNHDNPNNSNMINEWDEEGTNTSKCERNKHANPPHKKTIAALLQVPPVLAAAVAVKQTNEGASRGKSVVATKTTTTITVANQLRRGDDDTDYKVLDYEEREELLQSQTPTPTERDTKNEDDDDDDDDERKQEAKEHSYDDEHDNNVSRKRSYQIDGQSKDTTNRLSHDTVVRRNRMSTRRSESTRLIISRRPRRYQQEVHNLCGYVQVIKECLQNLRQRHMAEMLALKCSFQSELSTLSS